MATGKVELGQVVYVLIDAKQKVVPGILLEELINRTVDGTRITYVVQVGLEQAQKIKLEEDKVFGSLRKVKEHLTQKFVAALDKLIENADTLAKEWYGDKAVISEPEPVKPRVSKRPSAPPPETREEIPSMSVPTLPDVARVMLEDGTYVNVRVPQI